MNKFILTFVFCIFATAAEAMKVDTKLINEMLTTINQQYLYPADNAQIIADGLQFLRDFDARFTVSKGTDRIYIYHNNQLAAVLPFAQNPNDISAWSENIADTLNAAGKFADNIAVHDYELPDLFIKKVLQSLDEYSHYYSQFDYTEDDERQIFQQKFAERMIDDLLYLRVSIFNKQTSSQVARALKNAPNARGVILDLRGNSGGMLNEALKTADYFSEDSIITFTAGRDDKNKHYYTSSDECLFTKPLVILVDGNTASAAEVIAAGLQEQSRAKIIGTRTFGKGTIQNVWQLSNGAKLVLTGEQFFTPAGKVIHQKGVMPDICVEYNADDECAKSSRTDNDEDILTAVEFFNKSHQ